MAPMDHAESGGGRLLPCMFSRVLPCPCVRMATARAREHGMAGQHPAAMGMAWIDSSQLKQPLTHSYVSRSA